MKTSIDKFGRVAVPKSVRDRLGWREGTELAIEVKNDQLQLKAENDERLLRVEDGVLVYGGESVGDLRDAVRQDREEHDRKIRNGRR